MNNIDASQVHNLIASLPSITRIIENFCSNNKMFSMLRTNNYHFELTVNRSSSWQERIT